MRISRGADGKVRVALASGLALRTRCEPPASAKLRAAGMSLRAIAREIECSVVTVHRIIKSD